MMKSSHLHLFDGYGIEVEYIIVDCRSLDVLPVSDEVLRSAASRYTNDFEAGSLGWSNEFVLHVLELRNTRPVSSLSGLEKKFQRDIRRINKILRARGGRLMPTAMHPWMNPARETRLWKRRNKKIYETYDRIFGCSSHGWANVQSMQINISFLGDSEFSRLHSALRLVLPLVPALTASSPVVEGKITGLMDNRLVFYQKNQALIPSITGSIIPEAIHSRRDYTEKILQKMYRDIARYDAEGILQYEWLNSRGAIPRYDRSAIEIRIPDVQECPLADFAVGSALVNVLKALVSERWAGFKEQASWEDGRLVSLLDASIVSGEKTVIRDPDYLKLFGYPGRQAAASDVWKHLAQETVLPDRKINAPIKKALSVILSQGTLSRRILRALGTKPSRKKLHDTYEHLCECLSQGKLFRG